MKINIDLHDFVAVAASKIKFKCLKIAHNASIFSGPNMMTLSIIGDTSGDTKPGDLSIKYTTSNRLTKAQEKALIKAFLTHIDEDAEVETGGLSVGDILEISGPKPPLPEAFKYGPTLFVEVGWTYRGDDPERNNTIFRVTPSGGGKEVSVYLSHPNFPGDADTSGWKFSFPTTRKSDKNKPFTPEVEKEFIKKFLKASRNRLLKPGASFIVDPLEAHTGRKQ